MKFDVEETPIQGVQVVTRSRFEDQRGYLEKHYDFVGFKEIMPDRCVQQMNHTYTRRAGTVRGFHLQLPPHQEVKVVACLRGRVFDVALDLRGNSPTFLEWFGCELTDRNQKALVIPPGCAHGVQTLEMDCEMLYLHSALYAPESEVGVSPLSSAISVDWPLQISNLSERDLNEQSNPATFKGVIW